jgi:hypothetical protein
MRNTLRKSGQQLLHTGARRHTLGGDQHRRAHANWRACLDDARQLQETRLLNILQGPTTLKLSRSRLTVRGDCAAPGDQRPKARPPERGLGVGMGLPVTGFG